MEEGPRRSRRLRKLAPPSPPPASLDPNWRKTLSNFVTDYEQICRNVKKNLQKESEWKKIAKYAMKLNALVLQLQKMGELGTDPIQIGWTQENAYNILNEVTIIQSLNRDSKEFKARMLQSQHRICADMVKIYYELANLNDRLVFEDAYGKKRELMDVLPPEMWEQIWIYYMGTHRFQTEQHRAMPTPIPKHLIESKMEAMYETIPMLLSRLVTHISYLATAGDVDDSEKMVIFSVVTDFIYKHTMFYDDDDEEEGKNVYEAFDDYVPADYAWAEIDSVMNLFFHEGKYYLNLYNVPAKFYENKFLLLYEQLKRKTTVRGDQNKDSFGDSIPMTTLDIVFNERVWGKLPEKMTRDTDVSSHPIEIADYIKVYPFEFVEFMKLAFEAIQDTFSNKISNMHIRSFYFNELMMHRIVVFGGPTRVIQNADPRKAYFLDYVDPVPYYAFKLYNGPYNDRFMIRYLDFVQLLMMNEHVYSTYILKHPYFQEVSRDLIDDAHGLFLLYDSPESNAVRLHQHADSWPDITSYDEYLDHHRLTGEQRVRVFNRYFSVMRPSTNPIDAYLLESGIYGIDEGIGLEVYYGINDFVRLYRSICKNIFRNSSEILHASLQLINFVLYNDTMAKTEDLKPIKNAIVRLLRYAGGGLPQDETERLKHRVCEHLALFFSSLEAHESTEQVELLRAVSEVKYRLMHPQQDDRHYRFIADWSKPKQYDMESIKNFHYLVQKIMLDTDQEESVQADFARRLLTFGSNLFASMLGNEAYEDKLSINWSSTKTGQVEYIPNPIRDIQFSIKTNGELGTFCDIMITEEDIPYDSKYVLTKSALKKTKNGIKVVLDFTGRWMILSGRYTLKSIIGALVPYIQPGTIAFRAGPYDDFEELIDIDRWMRFNGIFRYMISERGNVAKMDPREQVPATLAEKWQDIYAHGWGIYQMILADLFVYYPRLYSTVWIYNTCVLDFPEKSREEWQSVIQSLESFD